MARSLGSVLATALLFGALGSESPALSTKPSSLQAVNDAATVPVAAGPYALVAFDRSSIQSVSASGKRQLNVASKQLRRPPVGSFSAPLEALVPSSPFGSRISPITGDPTEFHWGQDYAAACGTRVYAADAGVVRAVGWHLWGGGNRVEIDHGNGLITTYNHLQGIAVHKGDSVDVGQVIAKVGTTGSSTGCHLHFEVIKNGKHGDPLGYKMIAIKQVDRLGNIPMTDYSPGAGKKPDATPAWAVPVLEPVVKPSTPGVIKDDDAHPSVPPKTPTTAPTNSSTASPSTASPTTKPTTTPSASPSASPPASPTATLPGTVTPSAEPTDMPSATPSTSPSTSPSASPTVSLTASPVDSPTTAPSESTSSLESATAIATTPTK
ncbi:M23 family metallopeptidase [Pseudarthrobacter sp. J1738]|uniref:M23 family metallopeptidase n=1 Tax=unclassified Pseudarthrobacter TaxID=2647000 RepID=UPI003D29A2E4